MLSVASCYGNRDKLWPDGPLGPNADLFIHLGGERHCESKVSCPRTQHNVPGQGK